MIYIRYIGILYNNKEIKNNNLYSLKVFEIWKLQIRKNLWVKEKPSVLRTALLLINLYENSDTFTSNLGWGSLNHKGQNKWECAKEREREKVNLVLNTFV